MKLVDIAGDNMGPHALRATNAQAHNAYIATMQERLGPRQHQHDSGV